MESEVSVKELENNALAVAAKFGAFGLAKSQTKALTMFWAWKGKRQPKTGVGLKMDEVDERSSISGTGTATGEARARVARATERMADVNFMITLCWLNE
jgi:hypothetical protein